MAASWLGLSTALFYRIHAMRDSNEPYAEDGSSLILGALSAPWKLWAPVVDAVFIIPRLLATIATTANLSQAPVVLAALSVACVALVSVYCARPSLPSVGPTPLHRALFAVVVAGGIGSIEILGFAMGVTYALTLFLILLALETPRLRASLLIPLVSLLSFSTNSSFIAAPLFLLRGFTERDRCMTLCGFLTCTPVPVMLALAWVSQSPHSLAEVHHLGASLSAILERIFFFILIAPTAGNLLSFFTTWERTLTTIVAALLFLKLWRESGPQARLLSGGTVAAAALYITAHQFGRAGEMSGSLGHFCVTPDRFAFLLVPCGIIAWSTLLFDQPRLSMTVKNVAFFVMIGVQCVSSARYPVVPQAAQVGTFWKRFASQLEEAHAAGPGTLIDALPIAPFFNDGSSWGSIHCDTSYDRYIRCWDTRGNRDGAVYDIPRRRAANAPS